MAMKPLGKAILIGLVVVAVGVGVNYSGWLDKKPQAEASAPATPAAPSAAPAAAAPVQQAAPAADAAPPQPAPQFGGTRENAALDAMLNGKK